MNAYARHRVRPAIMRVGSRTQPTQHNSGLGEEPNANNEHHEGRRTEKRACEWGGCEIRGNENAENEIDDHDHAH